MLQHLLGVEVCDQERNIIALNRLSPQDEKGLCSLCQKSSELVH